MKTYEITFITKEDQKEKPIKTELEKLGGKILAVSDIGEKNFTYPIKKETKGFYTTVSFEIEPEKLLELNKKLALGEEILRHIVIIANPAKTEIPMLPKIDVQKEIAAPTIKKVEKKEEKVEDKIVEKPKKATKEAKKTEKVVKEAPKEKPVKKTPTKVSEIEKETESEEDRLKALDKKLDELLKE